MVHFASPTNNYSKTFQNENLPRGGSGCFWLLLSHLTVPQPDLVHILFLCMILLLQSFPRYVAYCSLSLKLRFMCWMNRDIDFVVRDFVVIFYMFLFLCNIYLRGLHTPNLLNFVLFLEFSRCWNENYVVPQNGAWPMLFYAFILPVFRRNDIILCCLTRLFKWFSFPNIAPFTILTLDFIH